jgi:hypothetical protein
MSSVDLTEVPTKKKASHLNIGDDIGVKSKEIESNEIDRTTN